MATLADLDESGKDAALQIMLVGHDGAHPHLPDVSAERADVLLALLRDIAYQMYTRPGKVRESAQLRKAAIEAKK
jgi:hypothetical protein